MDTVILNIITPDYAIAARWKRAFSRECWPVTVMEPGDHMIRSPVTGANADLIEVGSAGCGTPDDLKVLIRERRVLTTLVFAEDHCVSNSRIAAFLEAGADDFISKALDERVLVAKLKAHLRRILPAIEEAAAKSISISGTLQIDTITRTVKLKNKPGKPIEIQNLTMRELEILTLLVNNERKVVTREDMLEKLWGSEADKVYSECVDKHIESLRKKLGIFGKKIKTVYGAGYMFTESN